MNKKIFLDRYSSFVFKGIDSKKRRFCEAKLNVNLKIAKGFALCAAKNYTRSELIFLRHRHEKTKDMHSAPINFVYKRASKMKSGFSDIEKRSIKMTSHQLKYKADFSKKNLLQIINQNREIINKKQLLVSVANLRFTPALSSKMSIYGCSHFRIISPWGLQISDWRYRIQIKNLYPVINDFLVEQIAVQIFLQIEDLYLYGKTVTSLRETLLRKANQRFVRSKVSREQIFLPRYARLCITSGEAKQIFDLYLFEVRRFVREMHAKQKQLSFSFPGGEAKAPQKPGRRSIAKATKVMGCKSSIYPCTCPTQLRFENKSSKKPDFYRSKTSHFISYKSKICKKILSSYARLCMTSYKSKAKPSLSQIVNLLKLNIVNQGSKKPSFEVKSQKDSNNIILSISGGQDSIFLLFCLSFLQYQIAFKPKIIWCNHFWQKASFYTALHLTKSALAFSSPIVEFLPFHMAAYPQLYDNVTTSFRSKSLRAKKSQNTVCINFSNKSELSIKKSFYVTRTESRKKKPKAYKTFRKEISETRARNWRHITIERACTFYGSTLCLYGHTLSDRVETILFNLIRGTKNQNFQTLPWKRRHSTFCYNRFYPTFEQVIKSTHIHFM